MSTEMAAQTECNIRFRFGDKPDIGPFKYHLNTSVGHMKEMLLSDLNGKGEAALELHSAIRIGFQSDTQTLCSMAALQIMSRGAQYQ